MKKLLNAFVLALSIFLGLGMILTDDGNGIKESKRQGNAKKIILAEFDTIRRPEKIIEYEPLKGEYKYADKNPYVEYIYAIHVEYNTYEKVRLRSLAIANKNNWDFLREEKNGKGGNLRFAKKLKEYPGYCELHIDYNADDETVAIRITWFDGVTT